MRVNALFSCMQDCTGFLICNFIFIMVTLDDVGDDKDDEDEDVVDVADDGDDEDGVTMKMMRGNI